MVCCEKLRELIDAGAIVLWNGTEKRTIDVWGQNDLCVLEDLEWCPFCGDMLMAGELESEPGMRSAAPGQAVRRNPSTNRDSPPPS